MYKLLSLILIVVLAGCGAKPGPHEIVAIDNYTANRITSIIDMQTKAAHHHSTGGAITKISAEFLGTPYEANVLVGSVTEPEQLVIDFRGLDCFTYLDYVESFRKSKNKSDFIQQVINTRYIDGDVSYLNRKHFFTDWSHREPLNAQDVTAQITPHSRTVIKYLNQKKEGGEFIPSLNVIERNIVYIPAEFINDAAVSHLKNGDYIGIYTHIQGLDVTHTGIFVRTAKGPMLRNASSLKGNNKVVDSPFVEYVKKTPGIVVLRAMPISDSN
ncbi:DUF1460 domain-containing protein [Yersinia pekkanenii]|uniref:Lipoprotein n=1 Tax=Yersinia pekkanenii TaxID=1288385 RepID=A0A0T9PAD0_9GAMM|nr:DUF1460 domain-containing protein [Yersinia pekkanenii]CNH54367.1 putative lipoprotein [Yersinia pekkanenii]CRY67527.1 putative lipoprotein [Yersinia pekkanenii]